VSDACMYTIVQQMRTCTHNCLYAPLALFSVKKRLSMVTRLFSREFGAAKRDEVAC
jgi:hypothetical protein